MAPITTTTEVDRTPAEVFDYVTDPTHFVEWQRNVVGGHMDTDGPTTVGTKCLTTRKIGFAGDCNFNGVTVQSGGCTDD